MRVRPLFAGLIVAAFTVTGCGEARSDPAAQIVLDTLPNGTAHVQNPETGIWGDGEGWRLVEDLRIGSVHGDGPDTFGAIEVDEAGRIYVLDGQARDVRVFDGDGWHLRTLGGEGSGPGELRNPVGLTWHPDGSLLVVDPGNGRYQRYREVDDAGTLPRPGFFFALPWPGGVTDGGKLVDIGLGADAEGRLSRPVLITVGDDGVPGDTVHLPRPDLDEIMVTRPDGVPIFSAFDPFSPRPLWRLGPDGDLWVAAGGSYRIARVSPAGDTLRIVERAVEPPAVTSVERDSAIAAFHDRVREAGGRADRDPRISQRKPALAGLNVDDEGRLWTVPERSRGAPPVADVFDQEGRYLGGVSLPAALPTNVLPRITRDHLYTVVRDELDVPSVVRYRIDYPSTHIRS